MKKTIILFLLTLTLSGCMGYTELNKISVVKTLMIGYKDNEYKIQAEVILDNEENYETITSTGKTLDEVLNNAYQKFYKKLYMSHTELIILTNDVVDYKLKEVIEYFLDNTTTRNNFNLALVENEIKLSDLNEYIGILESETGTTKTINFEEFIKDLYENKRTYLVLNEHNPKAAM